jgi:hypothetical protein
MKTRYLIPALAAAAVSPVLANGGGYIAGVKSTGPFRPVNVENVEMVSEKLDIELKKDAAMVSIVYELRNPGKALNVEMGFPCSVAVTEKFDKDSKPLPPELPQLGDFSLTADGKAVKSELMKDHAVLGGGMAKPANENEYVEPILTGWQVVKLPFKEGQTRRVEVRYRNPYFRQEDSMSDNTNYSPLSMRYLFSAAALWSGPISKGEVTVRATGVNPDEVTLSHSQRFKRDGRTWKWSFTDFEPTMQDDLTILSGQHEYHQWREAEDPKKTCIYIMKGKSYDRAELQKNGTWFFHSRDYTATASSSLPEDGGRTYGPDSLNDNTWDNAWAEGAEGDGIGESITLKLTKPSKLTRILVENGYRGGDDDKLGVFAANNRVKKVAVSINGGKPFTADLPDSRSEQGGIIIPKDAGTVETVQLTIKEVYRGTKFRDTCLTGIWLETQLTKAPPIFPCR